jgi:XTP/dITP diphosphohydrolase
VTLLVVATGNAGKLREIRELLEGTSVTPVGLLGRDDVRLPEEGDDYRANAIAKARACAAQLGEPAVGDDSGLEVEALAGRPGPHSARYGGPGLDDRGRVRRLLEELAGVEPARRGARFVCHAALAFPDGTVECVEGVCEGEILERPSGEGGFGYDPIFRPVGESHAMAELPPARKNQISHRARAFASLTQTDSWRSRLST